MRTLQDLGEVQFTDVVAGTPERDTAFRAMCEVEIHSWKGRQGDAIDSHEETRRFYRALALEGPASQWTHLAVLRAGAWSRPSATSSTGTGASACAPASSTTCPAGSRRGSCCWRHVTSDG